MAGQQLILKADSTSDSSLVKTLNELDYLGDLNIYRQAAFKNHFLSFSIDSVSDSEATRTIFIHTGPKTKKVIQLEQNNKVLDVQDYEQYLSNLLQQNENNGYPFSSARIIPIKESNDTIYARIEVRKGVQIIVDSLDFDRNVIHPSYLYRLIQLKPGEVYSEKKIKEIQQKINRTSFLSINAPPLITFYLNKCIIHLRIKKKSNNQFNGYIGLLPKTQPEVTTYTLTGNIQLKLNNSFRRGENIGLKWNQFEPLSQDLKVNYAHPFLMGSPYGINTKFNLLKKDTSFVNLSLFTGIDVFISSRQKLTFFYENKSTIAGAQQTAINSSSTSGYGMEINLNFANDPFIPTKGWVLESTGSAGKRVLKGTDEFVPITLSTSDNITPTILVPKSSVIYNFSVLSELYIPLNRHHILLIATKGFGVFNPYLFENEVEWIGGLNNLRGFDDRSVKATRYAIQTLEYRFHLDQYSFFNLLYDFGYIQSNTVNNYQQRFTNAYGAGLNFSSKAGVISFTYAIGHYTNNPLILRDAKIHLGYVSLF